MNLSNIKKFFGGSDFLRPNRYEVIFHSSYSKFNKLIDNKYGKLGETLFNKYTNNLGRTIRSVFDTDIGRHCKSVSFPFYTFNTIDSFINNKTMNVINKIDYDPVSFTFLLDAEKKILDFLLSWKSLIIDQKYRYGYRDDYRTDIEIIMHHLHDSEVISCKLKNAFLINIDPIELGTELRDQISEITFSVQYDDIEYDSDKDDLRSFLKYT